MTRIPRKVRVPECHCKESKKFTARVNILLRVQTVIYSSAKDRSAICGKSARIFLTRFSFVLCIGNARPVGITIPRFGKNEH